MYLLSDILGVLIGSSSPSSFTSNKTWSHDYPTSQRRFDLPTSIHLPPHSRLPPYFSTALPLCSPHVLCLTPNILQNACRMIPLRWNSSLLKTTLLRAFQGCTRWGPYHLFWPGLVLTLLWPGSFPASILAVLSPGFFPCSFSQHCSSSTSQAQVTSPGKPFLTLPDQAKIPTMCSFF